MDKTRLKKIAMGIATILGAISFVFMMVFSAIGLMFSVVFTYDSADQITKGIPTIVNLFQDKTGTVGMWMPTLIQIGTVAPVIVITYMIVLSLYVFNTMPTLERLMRQLLGKKNQEGTV